jgi:hypothetical protein
VTTSRLAVFSTQPFEEAEFDPSHDRELMRGRIALAVSLTFLFTIGFFLFQASKGDEVARRHVTEAMPDVLPAVTTVLGTVIGFYFGSQKR